MMKKIVLTTLLITSLHLFGQEVIKDPNCVPEPNFLFSEYCHEKKIIPTYDFYICNDDPWTLIFEDDFDGYQLDEYKWFKKYAVVRDPNFESTKYLNLFENVVVEDGKLKLMAKEEEVNNFYLTTKWDEHGNGIEGKYVDFDYTGSEIESYAEFFYGKFEARVKLPSGKGLAPAFWTFGAPWSEIDIFEFRNVYNCVLLGDNYNPSLNQRMIETNIHTEYGSYGHKDCGKAVVIKMPGENDYVDFSKDFHVFTVDFEKQFIKWYVDGILIRVEQRYHTVTGTSHPGCMIQGFQPYVMNFNYPVHPMAVIFNMAVQNGDNVPDGSTVFPLQMEVDWIKVYKRKPCGQDVSISNENPFILDPNSKVLNSVTGVNVDIGGSFTVPTNHQVDVLAEHSITLGVGFSVESGGKFLADIVSPLCLSLENKREESIVETLNLEESDLKVFPNPSKSNFTLEVPKKIKKYEVKIVNLNGELIYFSNSETNTLSTINLGDRHGVFIVKVSDFLSGELLTKKIIIE